ncbi:hypothetical protein LCGC14_1369580 [marine sediment metagenome]|uniref:GATA-type domain-containing protein n=1 Tax=marine sediment metagenome TaxID=412755 RepID=A0A0F9MKZ2_9ZZZZ
MQKHGLDASQQTRNGFTCQICSESSAGMNWSDQHGEGMCNRCGTPYQLIFYDENENRVEKPPRINIEENWLPVLKQYWEETQQYTGLGTILISRDYPEAVTGQAALDKWLGEHQELIPSDGIASPA